MRGNKGQVSKVFVFTFSIIVILFAAFLVVKFVNTFLDDSTKVYEQKFYDTIEQNYNSVLKTYGSEKTYDYRVSSRVKLVCFVSKSDCLDTNNKAINLINNISSASLGNTKMLVEAGDNIIVFDENDVLESKKIGEFNVKNTGCLCVNPGFDNKFKLLMENVRNDVIVDEVIDY